MRTAVIVQARMGAVRFPGKVLLDLAGKPVLQHVVERCRAISAADVVVCAVPDERASEPLEEIAARCGAAVFRGPERDVLARYLGAAMTVGADVVMRVTADCPLIDPQICGEVLSLRFRESADYAANNMPRSFPHGLDCEAFTLDTLSRAAKEAALPDEREHVTPWMRCAEGVRRVNLPSKSANLAAHRWTLDYPEDFSFLSALFSRMPGAGTAGMKEIVEFLGKNPDISALNADRRSVSPQ